MAIKIKTEKNQDIIVVKPEGSLDVSIQVELKDELMKIVDVTGNDIVIDFGGVGFIDSSCLGTLVALTKKIREQDGNIKIANLNDDVRSIFQITRLDKIFDVFDDVETAVQSYFKS